MLAHFPLPDGFAHTSPSLSLRSRCGQPFHIQMGRDMVGLLPIQRKEKIDKKYNKKYEIE